MHNAVLGSEKLLLQPLDLPGQVHPAVDTLVLASLEAPDAVHRWHA